MGYVPVLGEYVESVMSTRTEVVPCEMVIDYSDGRLVLVVSRSVQRFLVWDGSSDTTQVQNVWNITFGQGMITAQYPLEIRPELFKVS